MDRLNDPDFADDLGNARAFWCVSSDADREARWGEWEAKSKADRHRLVLPLNIFEEMATMYVDQNLDRAAADATLGSASLQYWEEAEWLILRLRATAPPSREPDLHKPLLNAWEEMNADIRRRRSTPESSWPQAGGLWGQNG
jgi:hypothetical protein